MLKVLRQPLSELSLLLQAATLPAICGSAGSQQDVYNPASA